MLKLSFSTTNLNRAPSMREKVLFGAVVVAVLFLFVDFLWGPKSDEIRAYRRNHADAQQQIDAVKLIIDATKTQLNKRDAQPKKTQSFTDPYVQKILNRNIVDVAEEINTTADLMGSRKIARKIDIQKVDIGNRTAEGKFSTVPITVNLTGRYTAVKDYLKSLETIGRPLIVKRLSLKREGEKSSILQVKIETELFLPKM